jgi:hypothetical protein
MQRDKKWVFYIERNKCYLYDDNTQQSFKIIYVYCEENSIRAEDANGYPVNVPFCETLTEFADCASFRKMLCNDYPEIFL